MAKTIKIAFVSSELSTRGGGVVSVMRGLAPALTTIGGEVQVFGAATKNWREEGDDQAYSVPVQTFDIIGPEKLSYTLGMVSALHDWQPDIIHVHELWRHHCRSVWNYHRASGCPYIVSPHVMLSPRGLKDSKWKKRLATAWYMKRFFHSTSHISAISASEYRDICAYGLTNRVSIIPNGVNLPRIDSKMPVPWAGSIPPAHQSLLYFGRLTLKHKNLINLLNAWHLVQSHPLTHNWHLIMAGWGEDGAEVTLQDHAANLGLADRVLFPGPYFGADKSAALYGADAFILSSNSDLMPTAVLEAWAYGLPTLLSDNLALNIGFEKNASWLVDTRPEKMAQDILGFLALSSAQRRAMGKKALNLVKEHFLWPNIAQRLMQVYSEVLRDG